MTSSMLRHSAVTAEVLYIHQVAGFSQKNNKLKVCDLEQQRAQAQRPSAPRAMAPFMSPWKL
eukprot:5934996-Amphidinium_carterae.1